MMIYLVSGLGKEIEINAQSGRLAINRFLFSIIGRQTTEKTIRESGQVTVSVKLKYPNLLRSKER